MNYNKTTMAYLTELIINKIKRSGIIETIYLICSLILIKTKSLLRILILKIRGYCIDWTAIIDDNTFFFQDNLKSVSIAKNVRIGRGVVLKSGFGGKISVGKNVLVDTNSIISSQKSIKIGDFVLISAMCYIVDFNHAIPLPLDKIMRNSPKGFENKSIAIGNNVWIGTGSVILPGVTVGHNSVIGAGSVVTKSVPANCVAVGNPALVIKKLTTG